MKRFMQRYRNAKKCIAQIRAGEWVPHYNTPDKSHLTANRGNLELWIGNGGFFVEIMPCDVCYFGLFWRHYVWWAAARKLKRDADKQARAKHDAVPVL